MEWKIGEIKQVNGEWYQCVESDSCGECSLFTTECGSGTKSNLADEVFGQCSKVRRSDNKHAIFKKLEKVGEPYKHCKKLYQCYKLPMEIEIRLLPNNCNPIGKDNLVEIEIKQNKEDMSNTETLWYGPDKKEAKSLKLSNLKPFSLEAAKAGKPVCTRDGRKARIICFDRKLYHDGYNYPIVAMVNDNDNDNELVHAYTQDGLLVGNMEGELDLMMLPKKHEGWVNIYYERDARTHREAGWVYGTEEEAVRLGKECGSEYVTTAKIEWYE